MTTCVDPDEGRIIPPTLINEDDCEDLYHELFASWVASWTRGTHPTEWNGSMEVCHD